ALRRARRATRARTRTAWPARRDAAASRRADRSPGRRPSSDRGRAERGRELRQADVVAVRDVHVTVVEFLVLVRDIERFQAPREEARAEMQMPLVAAAAVHVEQAQRAQRVGVTIEQANRIVLEPSR